VHLLHNPAFFENTEEQKKGAAVTQLKKHEKVKKLKARLKEAHRNNKELERNLQAERERRLVFYHNVNSLGAMDLDVEEKVAEFKKQLEEELELRLQDATRKVETKLKEFLMLQREYQQKIDALKRHVIELELLLDNERQRKSTVSETEPRVKRHSLRDNVTQNASNETQNASHNEADLSKGKEKEQEKEQERNKQSEDKDVDGLTLINKQLIRRVVQLEKQLEMASNESEDSRLMALHEKLDKALQQCVQYRKV
jgi:hypothetical protein